MSKSGIGQRTDLKRLEEEIRELKEPIEKTIMDVRELIAEIDNAVITSPPAQQSRPMLKRPSGIEFKTSEEAAKTEGKSQSQWRGPESSSMHTRNVSEFSGGQLDLNLYVATSFIIRLVGHHNLERMLFLIRGVGGESEFLKRQIREMAEMIVRSLREDVHEKYPQPGSDAYLLCLHLLSIFLNNPSDPNIGLLIVTLGKLLLGDSLIRG